MYNLFCVPRINALGLKGPENSAKRILDGKDYEMIDIINENITEDEKKIYEFAKEKLDSKSFFVGGDHSITYPIGKACLEKFGREESFLIIFDAHADCMPSMEEPTHEEIVYGLVKRGWNPNNIVIIGVRKIEPEEKEFLEEKEIKYFNGGEERLVDRIMEIARGKKVYVSIDIDVVDPKEAPGVSYAERGGLKREELFFMLEELKRLDIRVYDLVEVVLDKDKEGKTLSLAREIVNMISK